MEHLAQTHLQLYAQLVDAGWAEPDLAAVRRAYELAARLHVGQLRPSGKPFLAHLAGTASAIARTPANPDIVCTALLHAAYEDGDWGDGKAGPAPSRREQLRVVAGADVEERVECYSRRARSAKDVRALVRDVDALSPVERDVVRVRVANQIDEYADAGVRFTSERQRGIYAAMQKGLGKVAAALDEPELGAMLQRSEAAALNASLPGVVTDDPPDWLATRPRSYRMGPIVWLRQGARRVRRGVAYRLGRRSP